MPGWAEFRPLPAKERGEVRRELRVPVQHPLPAPSPRCSRERVGVRALSGEFGLDCGKNAFEIAKNIVVPESKYSVTFFSQTAISYRVCSRFIVLSAVNLNYEKSFAADEITDVTAYRLLPNKFMSVDLPVANPIPESCFRIRLIDAQPSRDSDHLPIGSAHCPALTRIAPQSDLSPPKPGKG